MIKFIIKVIVAFFLVLFLMGLTLKCSNYVEDFFPDLYLEEAQAAENNGDNPFEKFIPKPKTFSLSQKFRPVYFYLRETPQVADLKKNEYYPVDKIVTLLDTGLLIYEYDENDIWQLPVTTLLNARGDCEDFAILALYFAKLMGYRNSDLGFLFLEGTAMESGHLVPIILDQETYTWQAIDFAIPDRENKIQQKPVDFFEVSAYELLTVYGKHGYQRFSFIFGLEPDSLLIDIDGLRKYVKTMTLRQLLKLGR